MGLGVVVPTINGLEKMVPTLYQRSHKVSKLHLFVHLDVRRTARKNPNIFFQRFDMFDGDEFIPWTPIRKTNRLKQIQDIPRC